MSRRKSSNVLRLSAEQAAELGLDLVTDLAKGNVSRPRDKFAAGRARRAEGKMTGPERARARELEADRRAGAIREWHYEPLSFRLGRDLFYTPDFLWIGSDGLLTAEEVKGKAGWLDAKSKVKWKAAGERYRWLRFVALVERRKRERTDGPLGRWKVEIYKPVGDCPPLGAS